MNFNIQGGSKNAKISVDSKTAQNGLEYVTVNYKTETAEIPERFSVSFKIPSNGCYAVWRASAGAHLLGADWWETISTSKLSAYLPVHTILSAKGNNVISIAVSDTKTPLEIGTGICEEDATLLCEITFFTDKIAPLTEYTATIRLDTRENPYFDSIYDVVEWWEKDCGYTPMDVPDAARLPMNSLWYTYHQNLNPDDIIRECELSKPLGMDTVIIDDGWQTEDNNRGYAFCGDWELATAKIPDMKELVDRIHATGMKVILWYSVPFIGIYSKNYERFKDMLLDGTGNQKDFFAFDPRYKEVRDFLIATYCRGIDEWGLDGFKLDFIDSFWLSGKSLEFDPRRDYQSLEEAIDALMTEVSAELKKRNSEILIEFRQKYIGPSIRKFGNMLRVGDCPNDSLTNRLSSLNLRLTSGKTAVHSDMIMWNPTDTVESAALQFLSILYAVPQVSMKLATLPEEHLDMLKYFLKFWRENREILLDGKLSIYNPEDDYSLACAELNGKAIFTSYSDTRIDCKKFNEVIAFNASRLDSLVIENAEGKNYKVYNCKGELVGEGEIKYPCQAVAVPLCGRVDVK